MFQASLFWYKHIEGEKKVEYIFIKCSHCDRSTGLILEVKTVKEMSTKFVLNTKLHHVGLSWIIYSGNQIKYYIKDNNHPDWLDKGQRYNTAKILGFNSFIIIIKWDKNGSWSYEKFVQKNTNYDIQTT